MGRRKQFIPKKSDNTEDQDASANAKVDEGQFKIFCIKYVKSYKSQ